MYYPVFGMVHIKNPLLLFGKNNPYRGSSRFLLSLSEWFFTIYLMLYSCKLNVLDVLLNKTFPTIFPDYDILCVCTL